MTKLLPYIVWINSLGREAGEKLIFTTSRAEALELGFDAWGSSVTDISELSTTLMNHDWFFLQGDPDKLEANIPHISEHYPGVFANTPKIYKQVPVKSNKTFNITVKEINGNFASSDSDYRHEYTLKSTNSYISQIKFQHHPIEEVGINGLTVSALLTIIIDRLEYFEYGGFSHANNRLAIEKLKEALPLLIEFF